MLDTSMIGASCRKNVIAESDASKPAPARLNLPEAVELLVAHFKCTEEHARDLLERAVYGGSLRDVTTFDAEDTELVTDVSAWRDIDWASGIVAIEPSWAGSPVQHVPIIPLLGRDELLKIFQIDVEEKRVTGRERRGRPLQHDWDAFSVEVCRRVYEDGLPETQAEFVDGMLDWFIDRGDESIDRSTIQKKISKLFGALRPD
jgi:hypothetical protein